MTALHATYRTKHGLTDAARELPDVGHYAFPG
jgi:hypothetical protein